MADLIEFTAPTRAAWRRWLTRNHASSPGVWLILTKKDSGIACVAYEEAVEEALCFGWIDSTAKGIDGIRRRQMFTPRKRKSSWSASNKARVARLIDQGLVTEAGLVAVERAKADGTWTAGDDAERLIVPPDLAAALRRPAAARRNFDAFTPSARKSILLWIGEAKRAETRVKRIATTARMAAANRRALIDDDV